MSRSAHARRPAFTFKDWRNGLGSQISTLVGVWAAALAHPKKGEPTPAGALLGPDAPLLVPLGGLRYANKALCAKRDLACYFEPFALEIDSYAA